MQGGPSSTWSTLVSNGVVEKESMRRNSLQGYFEQRISHQEGSNSACLGDHPEGQSRQKCGDALRRDAFPSVHIAAQD
eukprot:12576785-Alexandrium_andersonii.AAC.1